MRPSSCGAPRQQPPPRRLTMPSSCASSAGSERRSPGASGATAGCRRGQFCFRSRQRHSGAGSTFAVNVMLKGAQNVYSVPLQVSLRSQGFAGGECFQRRPALAGRPDVALVHRDDDSTGTLQITATRPPGATGISGQGTVVTLTFMAKASGQSALTISKGGARDPAMKRNAGGGSRGHDHSAVSQRDSSEAGIGGHPWPARCPSPGSNVSELAIRQPLLSFAGP